MVHTVVVANRKGGVGKTQVACHLAAGLSMLGYRVMLVDTDPQGHDALMFGLPKADGLYDVMFCEDEELPAVLSKALYQVPPSRFIPPGFEGAPELYLLPSSKATAVVPLEQKNPFKFKNVLTEIGELLALDFVVVDTGPTTSMFDGSVNLAADGFILPTELSRLSFDGLNEIISEVSAINKEKRKLGLGSTSIYGIIPNKFRAGNVKNQQQNISELSQKFGALVWPLVSLREVWSAASKHGQLVYSYMPGGQEATDAWMYVEKFLEAAHAATQA
ncbi:MAG: ParA family protein [bacterium]|nr:ParA family protein [bacterium]